MERSYGYAPSSASFPEYAPTASRRQSTWPRDGRCPASSLLAHTPGHLHERPTRACRRRSRSFHVSDFCHPTDQSQNAILQVRRVVCEPFPCSEGRICVSKIISMFRTYHTPSAWFESIRCLFLGSSSGDKCTTVQAASREREGTLVRRGRWEEESQRETPASGQGSA